MQLRGSRWLALAMAVLQFAVSAATDWSAVAARSKNGIIDLDSTSYTDLIEAKDREYAVVLVLTALSSQFNCVMCKELEPEYALVASSWRHAKSDEVFFARIDFDNGREVFQKHGLTSAPNLWLFPATKGPQAKPEGTLIKHNLNGRGPGADEIVRFLEQQQGLHIKIVRPFNYAKLVTAILVLAVGATAAKIMWPLFSAVVLNRYLWAAVSILFILIMTAGHMFVQIRQVPYVAANDRGGISWMAGGFQYQFGMETQIIACVYGLLAFGTISLAVSAPRIESKSRQTAVIYAWLMLQFLGFSFLLHMFRTKNESYPFKLIV